MKKKLLEIKNLKIGFPTKKESHIVVDDLSFSLMEGEVLGIVGESGSGKTMTALAIMGLLSSEAVIEQGRIEYGGKNLLSASQKELRNLKGKEISMIFQEPMTSLNPVMEIGKQVEEMLLLHQEQMSRQEMRKRTLQMLTEVGLKDVENLYKKYPHELSGGMRQRVMIAMAMICRPKLMIADEPTTALDVTVQMQILKLIRTLNREYGTAVLLISHDLGVIKSICTRTLVMSQGRLVEEGNVEDLFYHPKEDYTKKLLAAVPGRRNVQDIQKERKFGDEVLTVKNLDSFYPENSKKIFSKRKQKQVLKQVSLGLRQGEILGIVGESGCGKSTLAKTIVGLIKDYHGEIILHGQRPQMVFQDPYGSLNPAKTVQWILEEPLKIQGKLGKTQRKELVAEILTEVGLKEKHGKRKISQLSGGQRQRVSIACALISKEKVVVLDEPVSSLDVTVQAQILELLLKLRDQYGLSYLFISHDMNVIYQMCDRICVMYQGEIIESASREDIFLHPKKEYTKLLLESVPKI